MRTLSLSVMLGSLALAGSAARATDWPQWGGPGRNFRVPDPGLAEVWPTEGPAPLWSRPLGEGYSGIAVVGQRLYTLYGEGEAEVVVALDVGSGDELWVHRYAAPRPTGMRLAYGEGPHATPLVTNGRVFTAGTTAMLSALDADSGALLWQHDLWRELGGNRLRRGYGSSPIAYGETVVVPLGGEDGGVVALAQRDGRVVWQLEGLATAQSSPILIETDGDEQMVLFAQDEVVAFNPASGELLWRHPHDSFGPYNISTPVWGSDALLFVSSAYGGGSRVLRVHGSEHEPRVEELWHSKRMSVHFTNAIRLGDHVYASSGRGSVMAAAVQVETGELAWKDRRVGRANFIQVGERTLILEAEGRLIFAELEPEGISILAETQLLDARAWTIPSLGGHTLFVRDRQKILAVELPIAAARGDSEDN